MALTLELLERLMTTAMPSQKLQEEPRTALLTLKWVLKPSLQKFWLLWIEKEEICWLQTQTTTTFAEALPRRKEVERTSTTGRSTLRMTRKQIKCLTCPMMMDLMVLRKRMKKMRRKDLPSSPRSRLKETKLSLSTKPKKMLQIKPSKMLRMLKSSRSNRMLRQRD